MPYINEGETGMTNAQLDALLETIAKRIEAETQDKKAAEIVRQSKTDK